MPSCSYVAVYIHVPASRVIRLPFVHVLQEAASKFAHATQGARVMSFAFDFCHSLP